MPLKGKLSQEIPLNYLNNSHSQLNVNYLLHRLFQLTTCHIVTESPDIFLEFEQFTVVYCDDGGVEKDKSLPGLISAHWWRGLDISELLLAQTLFTAAHDWKSIQSLADGKTCHEPI